MNEQFKGERGPAPENIEDPKYRALQGAMDEEGRIMAEINKVFESTPDRAEAEKIVLEKYASQMDEAMRKSKRALDEWLRAIEESHEMDREPSAPKPIEITPSTEVRDLRGNLVRTLELSAERGTGRASGAVYLHIELKPGSAPASSAGAWKIENGELKILTGTPIPEGSPAYGIKVAVESHFKANPSDLATLEEDLRNI